MHLQNNMHFIRTTKALLQFTRCSVCPLNRLNRPALLFCGKCEKWCVFTHWVKSRTFFQFVVSHTCDLRLRRYSLNSLEPNRMNSVNLSAAFHREISFNAWNWRKLIFCLLIRLHCYLSGHKNLLMLLKRSIENIFLKGFSVQRCIRSWDSRIFTDRYCAIQEDRASIFPYPG